MAGVALVFVAGGLTAAACGADSEAPPAAEVTATTLALPPGGAAGSPTPRKPATPRVITVPPSPAQKRRKGRKAKARTVTIAPGVGYDSGYLEP